jgi:neurofibromin 1
MVLAMTICEICPPSEVEMMIAVLLNVFDSRTSLLGLIKVMIEREIAQTGILFIIKAELFLTLI